MHRRQRRSGQRRKRISQAASERREAWVAGGWTRVQFSHKIHFVAPFRLPSCCHKNLLRTNTHFLSSLPVPLSPPHSSRTFHPSNATYYVRDARHLLSTAEGNHINAPNIFRCINAHCV